MPIQTASVQRKPPGTGAKDIAVQHEGTELGSMFAQGLIRTRAINNIGMRRIGQQFINIERPKCAIAFR